MMFKIESSEQRLKRVLTENAGKFTIDEVQETMRRHFEALSKIKVDRK